VLVVTGPSGVGKGTLIRALREHFAGLELSISATTRSARPGEVDGRDYWFLSPEEFERQAAADAFLEHATYAGNRYGTPRSEIERTAPRSGSEDSTEEVAGLVLEIEVEGARQVRRALPEAIQVFVAPPSLEALRTRLVGRGSDSHPQIEDRLEVARQELGAREEFEHVIVNDRLERAAEELAELVARVWDSPAKGT